MEENSYVVIRGEKYRLQQLAEADYHNCTGCALHEQCRHAGPEMRFCLDFQLVAATGGELFDKRFVKCEK